MDQVDFFPLSGRSNICAAIENLEADSETANSQERLPDLKVMRGLENALRKRWAEQVLMLLIWQHRFSYPRGFLVNGEDGRLVLFSRPIPKL